MDAPEWLLLKCGACREAMRVPRGLAVVYVKCPSCGEVVAVPGGVLDPARRYHVFETEVSALPEVPAEPRRRAAADEPAMAPEGEGAAREEIPKPRRDSEATGAPRAEPNLGDWEPKERPLKDVSEVVGTGFRKMDEFKVGGGNGGSSAGHSHGRHHHGRRSRSEAPSWDSASARGRESSDRLAKRFVQIAVGGIIVLALGLGFLYWRDQQAMAEAGGSAEGGGGAGVQLVPADVGSGDGVGAIGGSGEGAAAGAEEAKRVAAATDAVESFLRADTLVALKKTVREADRVGPLIDAFYEGQDFRRTTFRSVGEVGVIEEPISGFMSLPVELSDRSVRAVTVEEVSEGQFRVDWESYVGHPSVPWTELLLEKPREETLMRVWAKADNYYNYDFADEVVLGCWRLAGADRQVQIYAYAPRGSEVAKAIDSVLNGGEKALVVKFRYPEVARESRQVVLVDVVQEGWLMP